MIAFVKPITVQKIMTRLLTYDRLEKRNKTGKKHQKAICVFNYSLSRKSDSLRKRVHSATGYPN